MMRRQWRAGLQLSSPATWIIVAAAVLLAALVRSAALWLGAGVLPFAPFFPAVLVCALLGGPRAGLLATGLSIVVVWAGFMPPRYGIGIPSAAELFAYVVFAVSCAVVVWLTEKYRQTMREWEEHERQRELTIRELEHRGKNTFAVVQAIVTQSLEGEREKAEEIVGRIHAVSSTNDLITHSATHTAGLRSIVRQKTEPFGGNRVSYRGDDIELPPQIARGMALVLHELVTNAVKYGALRSPEGHIDVSWRRDGDRVDLVWAEKGGPVIETPSTFGFGSRLVTRTLQGIGGGIDAEFRDSGLVCKIHFVTPKI